MFRIVIPSRYASTRLPGKPLLKIAGRPMLQWVEERARASGAAEVIVATDDERIVEAARDFGARVVMTSLTHVSGTDRIAEVAHAEKWHDDDIVVNLQGDEPMMPPELLDQVAHLLERNPTADMATLATRITSLSAFLDPNVVKVVTDQHQRALYFSRAPIPWARDSAPGGIASQRSFAGARRHLGVYAYRVASLARLAGLPQSLLEQTEKLEQLRALDNGMDIRVGDATALPGPEVNTVEDLARVATLLARGGGKA